MKKSLLWLSAAMAFILALKAQLPELSNYFAGSTQEAAISGSTKHAELAVSMMPNIRYVTPTGAGTKDGTSWANASDSLQAMIDISLVGTQGGPK
jgi:hypothetical protein